MKTIVIGSIMRNSVPNLGCAIVEAMAEAIDELPKDGIRIIRSEDDLTYTEEHSRDSPYTRPIQLMKIEDPYNGYIAKEFIPVQHHVPFYHHYYRKSKQGYKRR